VDDVSLRVGRGEIYAFLASTAREDDHHPHAAGDDPANERAAYLLGKSVHDARDPAQVGYLSRRSRLS
jgi:hypothetical protein